MIQGSNQLSEIMRRTYCNCVNIALQLDSSQKSWQYLTRLSDEIKPQACPFALPKTILGRNVTPDPRRCNDVRLAWRKKGARSRSRLVRHEDSICFRWRHCPGPRIW